MKKKSEISSKLATLLDYEDSFRFNEKSYWIPELNLIVFDSKEFDKSNIDDKQNFGVFRVLQLHESNHSSWGITGAVKNRMAWIMEAGRNLIEELDFNYVLKRQVAIDMMHLDSILALEGEAAFRLDWQIERTKKQFPDGSYDVYIEQMEINRDLTLKKNKKVKTIYNKLHDLLEWTKDYSFVFKVFVFSLSVPFVEPEFNVRLGNPQFNPTYRFETIYDALKKLDERTPLVERPSFSNHIGKGDASDLSYFLCKLTGFSWGQKNISEEYADFYNQIQSPTDYFKGYKPSKKSVKEYENILVRGAGSGFVKYFHNLVIDNYVYFSIIFDGIPLLVANIWHVPVSLIAEWGGYFTLWSLVQSVIKNQGEGVVIDLIKNQVFLPEEEKSEMVLNVKNIFSNIDYSKIDPVIEDDFKKTSKKLYRELNW